MFRQNQPITTIEELQAYLYNAMVLEHATIPTYLTTLYSIHPQTNSDAYHVIRVVAVEEMLHLTIAANLMNSIGGEVDLTTPGFVPSFPTYLPDGERDFEVNLACLAPETIETFLKIERPEMANDKGKCLVSCESAPGDSGYRHNLGMVPGNPEWRYYSIGEFYQAIAEGFQYLYDEMGDDLFCGDPAKQVTSEYYYSGGGDLEGVYCIDSALRSINLVIEQGEGEHELPYDGEGELAHYYRFQQLKLGSYYQPGDEINQPSGPPVKVDWNAVYPTMTNPRVDAFEESDPEVAEAARAFNRSYSRFLHLVTEAFNGRPELLTTEAVPYMFRLRDGANTLVRNPLAGTRAADLSAKVNPGDGPAHAAPTFEMPEA